MSEGTPSRLRIGTRDGQPVVEQLHQRGHHVQSAHGRRMLASDAGADAHSGAMIALMPTPADAKRLAVKGGEVAAELHCTLMFLGGDASAFPPEVQQNIIAALHQYPGDQDQVTTKVFGIGHWNGDSPGASWVWNVGDNPDADAADCPLDDFHQLAAMAVQDALMLHQQRGGDPVPLPDQHSPWVAHICAAYTDDLSLASTLEAKLGPVTFDRIRVSFGNEDTDIPLTASLAATGTAITAAAKPKRAKRPDEFRRLPNATELAARVDFAAHQRSWQQAVNGALTDWQAVTADWRTQIKDQILAGGTDALSTLSITTDTAADTLYGRMRTTAQAAGVAQQQEAEQQGVHVPPWSLEPGRVAALAGLDLLRQVASIAADTMGNRLVQAAKHRAMGLFSVLSGIRLASEVELALQGLSDAFDKQWLGEAMSAAQNAGRIAVLEAAPPATYYATEILDDRTCQPCQSVDGKAFNSLDDAEDAYPGGGYADCLGGGNCRGTIYAVWDQGMLASAEEGTPVTTVVEEELGGKPNKGTAKDKRLSKNKPDGSTAPSGMSDSGGAPCAECPDDAAHFGSSNTVSDAPWDGSPSNFTPVQYKTASAACDPGNGTPEEECFLPHHDPDGELNRAGLAAAAGRFSSLTGHSPAAVAAAKSHLVAHYNAIKEPVPDNLKAAAATGAPAIQPAPVIAPGGPTAPWSGVLAVEGVTTGDGREFAPDALTWQDPPIPLRWNIQDSHGGEPRTVAVNVGRIDTIQRVGNQIQATGVLDLSDPNGVAARDKIAGRFVRGVSIDADSIGDADIEMVWPERNNEGDDEEDIFAMLFAQPEKVIFHGGQIRAATLCDIPAFKDAYIQLTDADTGAVVAGGAMDPAEWEAAQVEEPDETGAVTASLGVYTPPAEWFADPGLSVPTPITVSDSGRIYGHAAQWGTCHIGQTGQCVQPPREDYHAYYMTGEVGLDDGTTASVGQITVGTGHASLNVGAQAAKEHYDHTGWAVADVVVGNDVHGIWVAGSIRADADAGKVAALRAAGQVSGDWRRIGGKLRLVGLLAVNVPGFPVPRMRARVSAGAQVALVAAGQPTVAPGVAGPSEHDLDQMAMRRVLEMLAKRVKADA